MSYTHHNLTDAEPVGVQRAAQRHPLRLCYRLVVILEYHATSLEFNVIRIHGKNTSTATRERSSRNRSTRSRQSADAMALNDGRTSDEQINTL